ncbi:MAG: hypothetical protein PWQ43_1341 [Rikenellaceae bacterium]|nr:hypothetical protein [Rikenellaceae bacterium]
MIPMIILTILSVLTIIVNTYVVFKEILNITKRKRALQLIDHLTIILMILSIPIFHFIVMGLGLSQLKKDKEQRKENLDD